MKKVFNYIFKLFKICLFFKKSFITYHARPKFLEDIKSYKEDLLQEKVAIVMQGPIKVKNSFTLETAKLYKKLYPNCIIILSTWFGENENTINLLKKIGIVVFQSVKPKIFGHGNINLQLISTRVAIEYAKLCHCNYILKTRSDQRIYAENSVSYLINILSLYPVKKEYVNKFGRIAVISNGCFKNRLYNVSDMLLFGRTEDICNYFSCPLDTRNNIEIKEGNDRIEYSKKRPGEIYFSTNYIESLGFKLKWSIEDSNYYFKELFVVVDAESLDWYWPKYSHREFRWRKYSNNRLVPYCYRDWLEVYCGDQMKNANSHF